MCEIGKNGRRNLPVHTLTLNILVLHSLMAAALLVACGLAIPAAAKVDSLEPATWFEQTSHKTWVVLFESPSCPHCKKLAPVYQGLASQLEHVSSSIKVGRVDCTKFEGLCRTFDVRRHPTQLLLTDDGAVYEYSGRRDAVALLAFAQGGYVSSGPAVRRAPTELLPNSSRLMKAWRMATDSGSPVLRKAFFIAICAAATIKGALLLLLRCARRYAKRAASNASSSNGDQPDKADQASREEPKKQR